MTSLLTNFTDSRIAAGASSAEGDITSGEQARAADPATMRASEVDGVAGGAPSGTISGGRRRRKSSKKSKKAKKSKARKSNKKRRSYRRPLFLL
jgi:hypothetical protein